MTLESPIEVALLLTRQSHNFARIDERIPNVTKQIDLFGNRKVSNLCQQ